MKFKSLLCTIALGALVFAACEKPEPAPQPQPEPKPEPEVVTPVVFSDVMKTVEGQKVTVSGKTTDFTYVDAEKTGVGAWYTAEGQTEKTKVAGTYDAETSTITATIETIPFGVYKLGVYANEDGKEQFSEGVDARIIDPATFSEVKAETNGLKITASGKVANFTFVDMETTAVGLWYKPAEGDRKEAKGQIADGLITATSKDLTPGTYTVGVWVRKELVKFYSEGVTVTIEEGATAGVEFGTTSINVNKDEVSISGRIRNFTFVDEATTPVGMWYAKTSAPAEKTRVNGTHNAENSSITASAKLADGEYLIGLFAKSEGKFVDSEGVKKTVSATTVNLHENTFTMTTDWKKAKLKGPGKLATFNGYQGFRAGKDGQTDEEGHTVLSLSKEEIGFTGNGTLEFYAVRYEGSVEGIIKLEVTKGGTIDKASCTLAELAGTSAKQNDMTNLKIDDATMHFSCQLTGITADSVIKITQGDTNYPVVGMWGIRFTPAAAK